MAQEFFCSASVLRDEMRDTRNLMHSVKNFEMTEDIMKRMNLTRPAIFCMAFSLELAAKAARVRVALPDEFKHLKALPFAKHQVIEICDDLPKLSLSDAERQCLKGAAEIVVNGKYPTDKRPSDDKTTYIAPNIDSFFAVAEPIYQKLMALACDSQSAAPGDAPPAARPRALTLGA
jgi:hypothetical protein